MKIGIDISQIAYKGGIVTYTQNLVRSLLNIDKENSYVLFASSLRQQKKIIDFINILQNKNATNKLFPLPPTILDLLWNKCHKFSIDRFIGPIDIFHSSDWTQPPTKAKKITTIHDLTVFKYPKYLPKQIVDVHKSRLSWVAKECDAVISDSNATKKDILYYLNIPEEKIKVVYLGVNSIFSPQDHKKISELKERYGIDNEYIVTFGSLGFRKNVKGTIKAFNKLQNIIPHSLVIIGGEKQYDVDDKTERIIHLDRVCLSDLPVFFTGASCFVYPSFYEGFGLPVLESMACGCLVVSSDKGSLKEITNDATFIVDPQNPDDIAQKIQDALNLSDEKYANRVKKGLEHAKKFTWEKTARETLKVYKEVVS